MDGYDITSYGAGFAEVYDRWYQDMGDLDGCVAGLARLAAAVDGPVLELGVGTGRVALPLSERVSHLTGVDASPEMLAHLRSKPGADRLTVIEGDMADVPVPTGSRYGLVYFTFNTFFTLMTVDDQARCLRGVAEVLVDGGHVVVEGFVPDDDPPDVEGVIVPVRMTTDTVVLTATLRDPFDQTIAGQHIELDADGPHLHPWFIRYTRPDELDRMAAAAGLELVERSAGWLGEPFDDTSSQHVSVYRPSRP